ncbi:MAG TPA: COX15/CtaA family protein [Solirubrobacteraceae bacterium]|nr:COX15/CtaA family protein [Solirubrobacteraceae bacterium]
MASRLKLHSLPRLTPVQYRRVAYVGLGSLALIVLTGAAVRLTDSGLGCPDWPRCYGKALPPLSGHAVIEYSNRAVSGLVGVIAVLVFAAAFLRRPYRRDLAWLAATLPLGVVAQAVLGGFTVREHLAPGFVMAHFSLSMIVLIGAVALAWRSAHEPGSRPLAEDRLSVWAVRALLPLGALAIFAGTAATAAGPHSGGITGQHVHRLTFEGRNTLTWVVHRHATIAALLGVAVIAVWFLHRRRGMIRTLEPLMVLGVLMAAQGLVGSVQYELRLPSDMVWVHVALATATWLALLWSTAAAGTLAPREARETVPGPDRLARPEPLVPAVPEPEGLSTPAAVK